MQIVMPQPTPEEYENKILELNKIIGEQQDKLHEKDIEIATSRAFNQECLKREDDANGFIKESMEYIRNWKEVVDICDGIIALDSSNNMTVQNYMMKFLRHHSLPQMLELQNTVTNMNETISSKTNVNEGLKLKIREFANSIRF